jgi:hypothetical protein
MPADRSRLQCGARVLAVALVSALHAVAEGQPAAEPDAPVVAPAEQQPAPAPTPTPTPTPAPTPAPRRVQREAVLLPASPTAPSAPSEEPDVALEEERFGHGEPALRLSVGVAGLLTVIGSEGELNTPLIASLDAELSLSPAFGLGLRAAIGLTDPAPGLGFLGALLSHWAEQDLYVAAALGVAAPVERVGDGLRGLSVQAEVGQLWRLGPRWSLNLAPHFELVTPLLGEYGDVVTVGFGLVLVATWR